MGVHRSTEGGDFQFVDPEITRQRQHAEALREKLGPQKLAENALMLFYTALDLKLPEKRIKYYGALVDSVVYELSQTEFGKIDNRVREALGLDVQHAMPEVPGERQLGYVLRSGTDGGDTPSDKPPMPSSAH